MNNQQWMASTILTFRTIFITCLGSGWVDGLESPFHWLKWQGTRAGKQRDAGEGEHIPCSLIKKKVQMKHYLNSIRLDCTHRKSIWWVIRVMKEVSFLPKSIFSSRNMLKNFFTFVLRSSFSQDFWLDFLSCDINQHKIVLLLKFLEAR